MIRTPILIGRRSTSHSPAAYPYYYYIPPRVDGLLPDRPPEVSHMAYCCVMGTTGLDEKMYNIIGQRGLGLGGGSILILNGG